MAERLRVLFVCVGNACRSQMAEALARHLAPDLLEASSAGISPLGNVPESTRLVLLEQGVRMDGQYSKGMSDGTLLPADVIVNLTGIPGTALFPNAIVIDWDVTDPYGDDVEAYRRVRDDIDARLREWISELAVDFHDKLRDELPIEAGANAGVGEPSPTNSALETRKSR
jgi:protein-tyrosine-phosphatase